MDLFKDKRTHFKKGKMLVQTTQPFYEPGATVEGKIYIQVDETIQAENI